MAPDPTPTDAAYEAPTLDDLVAYPFWEERAGEIEAHADKHAPKDGNYAQLRLRRHLLIAARVAAGPITPAEVAKAFN